MPQSVAAIYVHIIFSTKHRKRYLQGDEFPQRLHAYLAGICRKQSSPAIRVGGFEDHVHILCRLQKTLDLASFVREIKRDSSKWVKAENERLQAFQWQSGYGAFSVSPGHLDALVNYIEHQVEHHQQESFQEEFRRICAKYGESLDERYAWE